MKYVTTLSYKNPISTVKRQFKFDFRFTSLFYFNYCSVIWVCRIWHNELVTLSLQKLAGVHSEQDNALLVLDVTLANYSKSKDHVIWGSSLVGFSHTFCWGDGTSCKREVEGRCLENRELTCEHPGGTNGLLAQPVSNGRHRSKWRAGGYGQAKGDFGNVLAGSVR